MTQNLLYQQDYTYKEQDPAYMGEPFDNSLAEGPREDRRCKDCFCCILYILFWGGLIVVAIIAFKHGQPHLLASPFDSTGQQCGYSPGYQQFKYSYFNMNNKNQFVCINECPSQGLSEVSRCMLGGVQDDCQRFGSYKTIRMVSFCLPMGFEVGSLEKIGLDFYQQSISDLRTTWPISLAVLGASLLVSVFIMYFIQMCGGIVVILVIALYFCVLIALGVVSMEASLDKIQVPWFEDAADKQWLQAMAFISWGIAAISLVVLLCSLRKLKIAIMIIKTTGQFARQECQTVLVPIFMFLVISCFFALWVLVSIYIFSSGQVSQCHGAPYACIDWDIGVKRSLGFYFFGLFWNCQVVIGVCQFVIASTTAYWYFSNLNHSQFSSPVCKSFFRGLLYHIGSIAFGALILCIFWLLQFMFQLLHHFGKQKVISQDPITNMCYDWSIKCVRCCLACFERFMRFITRNAFIMMAITGESFCSSAHQSFYLIMRSSSEYAITHGIGHFIAFFGKILIAGSCTLGGYLLITQIDSFSQQIFSPFMPTLLFFVISFVVSTLFMDVFGVGADTILMCYCLQMDILRGLSRACPRQLKEALEASK